MNHPVKISGKGICFIDKNSILMQAISKMKQQIQTLEDAEIFRILDSIVGVK